MSFRYSYNYPQAARDAGFKLRQYSDGLLDWRLIGSLEIERILREQNLDQIDDVLCHLSEVPLGTLLETNILDSGIAKFFILSQFAVQYLLFCRNFLEDTINDLRESHSSAQMQVAHLKRSLSEANNEILQLHKKISQMEAIHEVIYPCHLCTKNFVSNDALNLHITRKHENKTEKRPEALPNVNSTGAAKQNRELTDFNLINTIKLELEIKQLKERLNNAEREIKELPAVSRRKHIKLSSASSAEVSPSVSFQSMKPSRKSIGIQNNLMEAKEQDEQKDSSEVNRGDCGDVPSSSKLIEQTILEEVLQNKLQNFEIWKDKQQKQLQEFLNDINQKLYLITTALESQKKQYKEAINEEHHLNELSKSSIAALENRLTTKIDDIGQKNIDKIQIAINQIQLNYQDKLEELKDDLMKIISKEKSKIHTEPQIQESNQMTSFISNINVTPLTTDEEGKSLNSLDEYNDNTYDLEIANIIHSPPQLTLSHRTLNENDKVSSHSELQSTVKEAGKPAANLSDHGSPKKNAAAKEKQIEVEATKTFRKATVSSDNEPHKVHFDDKRKSSDDNTDISDNLQNDEITDDSRNENNKKDHDTVDVDDNNQRNTSVVDKAKDKTYIVHYNSKNPTIANKNHYRKSEQTTKYLPSTKAKQVTRSEVRRLFNHRLKSYDLNIKTDSISSGAMKRTLNDIHEHRNVLKKENKQFSTTRNNLKKFINKLCSNKMSTSTETLLEKTQPKQSFYKSKLLDTSKATESATDEGANEDNFDSNDDVRASTPLNESSSMDRDEFKQKLNKILSSPINKPNGSVNKQNSNHHRQFEYTAMVHQEMPPEIKPVPLPRKKVMFNEQNLKSTNSANLLYHSYSGSDSDNPKEAGKRQQLSSSLGNLS